MKLKPPFSEAVYPCHIQRYRSESGIALVMVLSIVSLLVILVMGFLMMVRSETKSSSAYAKGEESRLLAELPLNLVIAQIRKATENNGSTKTWASQPGMIRVFGQSAEPTTGRTALDRAYKLYSAAQMEVTAESSGFAPQINPQDELPVNWSDQPASFTDLNAPVYTDRDGNGVPINPVYPIADPAGFSDLTDAVGTVRRIEGAQLANGSGLERVPRASGTDANPLPMPVRWLYVLQDGTFSVGTPEGNGKRMRVAGATADNPVTGRVAFWADDESSKVNINTASEGVFWDTPLGNTKVERGAGDGLDKDPSAPYGYASSIPVRNEFSRYPGHPARTSLSAVLGAWLPLSETPTATELDNYYRLSPRVALGGTQGGTKISTYTGSGITGANNNVGVSPVDKDRLYGSPDELVFSTSRQMNPPASTPGGSSGPVLSASMIERARFFLTAHSRAPEVNLFNKPRIALWPFSTDVNYRNAVDKLIAFASTTNQLPFYFQRSRSTNDAANNSSSDQEEDYTNVSRNQRLYTYLQKLSSTAVPGFGGDFKTKYGSDADQIATEMFDYVRGQVNVTSTALSPKYSYFTSGGDAGGECWVAPLKIGSTKGFGRFPTITEAALVFTGTAKDENKNTTGVQCFLLLQLFRPTPGIPHTSPSFRVKISGLDAFRLNEQPLGFPANASIKVNVSGYVGGWAHSAVYQNLLTLVLSGNNTARTAGAGNELTSYPFVSQIINLPVGTDPTKMTFSGAPLELELSTGVNPAPGKLVQKLKMDFSGSQELPRPKMLNTANDGARAFQERFNKIATTTDPGGSAAAAGSWGTHMYFSMAYWRDHRSLTINSEDVVRSVHVDPSGPSKGDFRLLALTPEVPATWFRKHAKWGSYDPQDTGGHSLREERWLLLGQPGFNPRNNTPTDEVANVNASSASRPSSWSTAGGLVKDLKYASTAVPAVPAGTNGALKADDRPGDWENGAGIFPDGPFIRHTLQANYNQRSGGYYVFGYMVMDDTTDGVNFTPSRQITSAVQFGAMPTGVKAVKPWQTLLFCPNPASRRTTSSRPPTPDDHFGFTGPNDHLFLDFFWMKLAETYAISEPFSTAGKVNMNSDIMPFRYIKRRTGLAAVLKSTRMAAMPPDLAKDQTPNQSDNYKGLKRCPYDFRYALNLDAQTGTLRGFEDRFASGDVFRSASEICELFLVPAALPGATYHPSVPALPSYTSIVAWWNRMTLTGDNARESPYNDIYPRLTTKSNVFQVHYRVQLLRKARSSDPDIWDEDKDQVAGEQRGSAIVERYIDPSDRSMPDMANPNQFNNPSYNLDRYYRYRVVQRRQFAP